MSPLNNMKQLSKQSLEKIPKISLRNIEDEAQQKFPEKSPQEIGNESFAAIPNLSKQIWKKILVESLDKSRRKCVEKSQGKSLTSRELRLTKVLEKF